MRKSLAAIALLAVAWPLADSRGEDATATPGVAVGAKAPDFELPDQQGNKVSLPSLLKQKPWTAVVFYRSASW